MFYKYTQKNKPKDHWIDYLQTINNLDITSLGKFMLKEVHYTKVRQPATSKKDWVSLHHITIEAPTGKKIHWYLWNKNTDRDLRIEEMMGTKKKEYNTNQGEIEFVAKVLADIKEKSWF